jgi:hypothetical protein
MMELEREREREREREKQGGKMKRKRLMIDKFICYKVAGFRLLVLLVLED